MQLTAQMLVLVGVGLPCLFYLLTSFQIGFVDGCLSVAFLKCFGGIFMVGLCRTFLNIQNWFHRCLPE